MNSFLSKLSSLILPLSLSSICFAAEPTTPASTTPPSTTAPAVHSNATIPVGVIDMQRIILSTDEGKEARAALEKEMKGKEDELRKKKEELDKLNKEWKDQAPLLSEEARIRKQQDFQEKLVELRNSEMTFQQQLKQKEGQATQRIAMKVTSMMPEIAKHSPKKVAGIFEVNSSGLVWLEDPVDFTDQVIKKYNETTKADRKKGIENTKSASKTTVNNKM